MKLTQMFAAALLIAGVGVTTGASAQRYDGQVSRDYRGDRYDRDRGDERRWDRQRGEERRWDRRDRRYDHRDDRRGHRWGRHDNGNHYGWRNNHRGRDCRIVWRHGQRTRICR